MRLAYFLMFSHLAVYVQYLQLHLRSLGHGNGEVGLLMGLLQVSGVAGAPGHPDRHAAWLDWPTVKKEATVRWPLWGARMSLTSSRTRR